MAIMDKMISGIKLGLERLTKFMGRGEQIPSKLFGGALYCRKEPFGADLYCQKPPFGGDLYCDINSDMIYR